MAKLSLGSINVKAATKVGAQVAPPAGTGLPDWMKRGKAAGDMLAKADAEYELRKQDSQRAWRFRLKVGEEASITFLDGTIIDESSNEGDIAGMLDCPTFLEHEVELGGRYQPFVCTEQFESGEPCPICRTGSKPYIVALFTVIDHRSFTSNKGKVYENEKRILAARSETLKKLLRKARKLEGSLVLCTFEVSRSGDKTPRVGDEFEFVRRWTKEEFVEAFPSLGQDGYGPLDYGKEAPIHTPEELIKLGVGAPGTSINTVSGNSPIAAAAGTEDEL